MFTIHFLLVCKLWTFIVCILLFSVLLKITLGHSFSHGSVLYTSDQLSALHIHRKNQRSQRINRGGGDNTNHSMWWSTPRGPLRVRCSPLSSSPSTHHTSDTRVLTVTCRSSPMYQRRTSRNIEKKALLSLDCETQRNVV